MSETGRAAEETEYRDLIRSMCEERIFLAAEEVEHYDAARTVRLRAGSLTVSDPHLDQLPTSVSRART